MLRRRFSKVLAACSLSLILSGCVKNGPKVDVCVSDPDRGGFQCIAKDEKTTYFIEYRNSAGVVGIPADDFKTMLEWIKRNAK